MAARELKARRSRKDGSLLSGWTRRLFRGRLLEELQEITSEIGMLGHYGLDINDPRETHVLRALPGRTFSALELLCIMYARLAEDRVGDGYREGSGRGVGYGCLLYTSMVFMLSINRDFLIEIYPMIQ